MRLCRSQHFSHHNGFGVDRFGVGFAVLTCIKANGIHADHRTILSDTQIDPAALRIEKSTQCRFDVLRLRHFKSYDLPFLPRNFPVDQIHHTPIYQPNYQWL